MSDAMTKPNRKLLEGQMATAEYKRQDMIVEPEPGTTLEEMLNPEYWANVARRLRTWDHIEVRAPDATWMARLVVLVVQPFAVRVHVMEHVEFTRPRAAADEVPDGYEVKNRGVAGWAVIRLSDKVTLREKEQSRIAAVAWLRAHIQALGTSKAA